jgi:sialic acid synthase SpsE
MNISGIEIGPGQPCRFVAELSNNHNGDRDRCGRLIDAAKAAGADFIKLQCYTADELVALRGDGPAPEPWGSQGWTMRTLYEYAATPLDWFPLIKAHCERIGMPWFSSVFGPDSLAMLEALDCPAYKIARLDNRDDWLAQSVCATGKPVIVSESESGDAAASGFRLYCPPGYPQQQFAFDGRFAPYVESHAWMEVEVHDADFDGFSYHGTDPLPCIVAATLGAKLIEVHFQLYAEPSELEANVSLTPGQFREMVDTVRKIEGMLV